MVKKVAKFLVVMLMIIMLLSPTAIAFTISDWGKKPGGEKSIYNVSTNTDGLFCTNHGYRFLAGDYRVYETGPLSNLNDGEGGWLLSFIIGDMQKEVQNGDNKAQNGKTINPANSRNGQEWQELIWHLIGINAQAPNPSVYQPLLDKYQEYKEVKDVMDNDITIEFDPDVAVANDKGMIGPFKVNYPYKSKVDEYIDLKITMTDSTTGAEKILFEKSYDNTITNIITSDAEGTVQFVPGDTEFYFPLNNPADGSQLVNYGKKYKFNIEWTFTHYNMGQYWKMTPGRDVFYYVQCKECADVTMLYFENAFYNPKSDTYVSASGNLIIDAAGNPQQGLFNGYAFDLKPGDSLPDFTNTKLIFDSVTGDPEYVSGYIPRMWDYSTGSYWSTHLYQYGKWAKAGSYVEHRHILEDPTTYTETYLDSYDTQRVSRVLFADLKYAENGYVPGKPGKFSLTSPSGYYLLGGNQHGYQNYIFLMTTASSVTKPATIEVLVGQPDWEIDFDKVDKITGLKISGIEFEASVDKGFVKLVDNSKVNPYSFTTTDADTKLIITPDNATHGLINEMVVTLTEKDVPEDNNHLIYRGNLEYVVTWNSSAGKWDFKEIRVPNYNGLDEVANSTDVDKNIFKLTAENRPIPNFKILLHKVDSLTGSRLGGVNFNIEVENGTVVGMAAITTNASNDTEIEIKPNKDTGSGDVPDVKVTLKELSFAVANSYLLYKGDIVITYHWNPDTCEWENTDLEFPTYDNGVEEKVEITKEGTALDLKFTLTVENRPEVEELSGYVWIDGVTGEKNIDPPNGIHDGSEGYKAGVKVYLYKTDGTKVEYDGYGVRFGPGGEGYLVTDGNGRYEFKELPKLPAGEAYYIAFEYDGINYIRTILGGDSKADEPDRASYNAGFKTISAGQSNNGTSLEYTYGGNASTLITENGDGTVLDKFAIIADTQTAGNTYNEKATDINLGISRKKVDLALMTDLHKATATINGANPATVVYNNNFDSDIDAILNVIQGTTADGVNYNINLYRSDYNYRIGNYINDPTISHQPSLDAEEQGALQASREELKVELEYIVILSNQSTTDASVDEFKFYYDSHLKPIKVTGGAGTATSGEITIIPDNPKVGNGEYREVKITFEAIGLSEEQLIKNYAEITKYSTDVGGYVDCDSAPGSGTSQYEDDMDEARGAVIKLSRTDREISGNVFEDNKIEEHNDDYITGNGIYDAGENKIDDVIVQLIEIKNLTIGATTTRLEYIWQETTTGTNIVKKISDDGTKLDTIQYSDVTPEPGKYVFRGFIPGDYIIRFIYGDGTYFDTAINSDNILKYNGQDYKSTMDEKSDSQYLVNSSYSSEESSMARDNEARRLEVMAYALGVADGNDLIIDSKEKLENTWMVAETSRAIVQDAIIEGVATFKIGVNFGLVAKPEAKLSLRKHIESATLTDSSGNPIVQASVNVNNQYSDYSTEITDFRSGIQHENAPIEATATTRQNRGYWQVEANNVDGAKLALTYKYKVTNVGEPDFLNQNLLSKFNYTGTYDSDIENYINELKDCAKEVKESIKSNQYDISKSYLGQAYYTGKKGSDDVEVKTYVNVEDYLKALSFESSTQFESVNSENKKIINSAGNEATEPVNVIRTKNGEAITVNSSADFSVNVRAAVTGNDLVYRSYIAQIITPVTTLAGTKITGSSPNNLKYVQSYYSVARLDDLGLGEGTEEDEFWAETFRIIPTTGADKKSGVVLAITITTGLSIIVIGVILIKKLIKI